MGIQEKDNALDWIYIAESTWSSVGTVEQDCVAPGGVTLIGTTGHQHKENYNDHSHSYYP